MAGSPRRQPRACSLPPYLGPKLCLGPQVPKLRFGATRMTPASGACREAELRSVPSQAELGTEGSDGRALGLRRQLSADAITNPMSLLPAGRPLQQVVPDLDDFLLDPASYLREAPLVVGPRSMLRL